VQQKSGSRRRGTPNRTLEKSEVLQDLTERIERLFPGLPGSGVDPGVIHHVRGVEWSEVLGLDRSELGVEPPQNLRKDDACRRRVCGTWGHCVAKSSPVSRR